VMAHRSSNRQRNRWVVSLLDVRPTGGLCPRRPPRRPHGQPPGPTLTSPQPSQEQDDQAEHSNFRDPAIDTRCQEES
jgi:hypothetical protein